ncbi:MAG: hypothetical protein IT381_30830 [Deltaproteobacteria bacterium]|nr:hypothetical protein [Deltaproteobacteria bacterium]
MKKLVCLLALASACQVPPAESQTPTGTLGTTTKPSLTCPEDYTACGNICVDADNDPRHCGACNNACEAGALCLAGSCRAGAASCDRTHGCPTAYFCDLNKASCVYGCIEDWQCKAPFVCNKKAHQCYWPDAPATPGTTPETSTEETSTPVTPGASCAMENDCANGLTCQLEAKRCVCAAGTSVCSGTCKALATDVKNCGLCGLGCAAGQGCKAGLCFNLNACDDFSCPLGQHCDDVSGACAPGCTLPHHCRVGEVCDGGTCEACVADCRGKACGDDGCGGTCGACGGSDICSADSECVTPSTAVSALDLLLIVDDSGSMEAIQNEVKTAAPLLIDALDATGVDYRIGVTTTDLDRTSPAPGALLTATITVVSAQAADRKAQLGAILNRLTTQGSPTEYGAMTALVAATPSATSYPMDGPWGASAAIFGARNAQLWRDNARFGVLLFSDEDDASGDLTKISLSDIAAQLVSKKSSPTLVRFAAIIETNATTQSCTRVSTGAGAPQYSSFMQALGTTVGKKFDICQSVSTHVPGLAAFLTQ